MKKTHNNYKKKLNFTNHLIKKGLFSFKISNFKKVTKEQQNLWLSQIFLKNKKISKKKLKIWSISEFNKSLTKLNLESRMGKGKGEIIESFYFYKPNHVLLEFTNVTNSQILEIYQFFKKKVPSYLILNKRFGF